MKLQYRRIADAVVGQASACARLQPRRCTNSFPRQQLGDAEIEKLDHAIRIDQNIAGLDVAMRDSLAMGVVDRGADVLEEL